MSITGFNRRRRELEKLEDLKNEEVSSYIDTSKTKEIDYSKFKADELKEIAKEKGIEGYSDMKKAELIEVLK